MQDKIKRLDKLISNLEKYTDKVKSELGELRGTDNMTQCHEMSIEKLFSEDNLRELFLVSYQNDLVDELRFVSVVFCNYEFYLMLFSDIPEDIYDCDDECVLCVSRGGLKDVCDNLELFTGEYKGKEYKNGVEVKNKEQEQFLSSLYWQIGGNNIIVSKEDSYYTMPHGLYDNWMDIVSIKRPLNLLNVISFTIEGESTRVYSLNGKILNGWFNGKFYKDGKEI
jgi:hypothetical protein